MRLDSKRPRSSLEARDLGATLAIVALALALRLLNLYEIQSLPTLDDPISDARSYHEWAQRIAAGDWRGDRVFYQAPAYPYFLALVYTFFEDDLLAARLAQSALGALACGFLALATTLFLGRVAGIAAGVLLALYPSAIFFDGILQKASLAGFLLCLLLFFLGWFHARPAARSAVAAGAMLALLGLTRENALVFAPVIVGWLFLGFRKVPAALRARWTAAFALGLLLPLLLVGARNWLVGGSFALTTSQLGPNFYIGNNAEATGVYTPLLTGRETPEYEGLDARRLAEQALGRELTPSEVSRYWLGRAGAFIRAEPAVWLGLLVKKSVLVLNRFEIPDAEDLYLTADHSRVLRWLAGILDFSVILGLAAAGALFARRLHAPVGLLAALLAVFVASVVFFYVFARYRFPMVPLLLPFAGLAVAEGRGHLARWELRALAAPAVAALLVGILARLPIVNEAPLRATPYYNAGSLLIARGRIDEAEHYLLEAEALFADSAELQVSLGLLRLGQGRLREAEAHARRALALRPGDPRAKRLLARVRARDAARGDPAP